SAAIGKVRAGDQPESRQSHWTGISSDLQRPRRRGDRVAISRGSGHFCANGWRRASSPEPAADLVGYCHSAGAGAPGRRGVRMKRREFITLIGGAAAMPVVARAQERVRRVGVLMYTTPDEPESQARISALAQGLQDAGWSVGRNVRIDTRWS